MCVAGAEGKPEGQAERAHGGPVPLHPVARHGGPGVHPARPHLHPPLLGCPHPGHGPRAGALQVGPLQSLTPRAVRFIEIVITISSNSNNVQNIIFDFNIFYSNISDFLRANFKVLTYKGFFFGEKC